jgi:hypothetical protein
MWWLEWLEVRWLKRSSSQVLSNNFDMCRQKRCVPHDLPAANGVSRVCAASVCHFAWLRSWLQVCLGVQLGTRACFQAFHATGRSATYDRQVILRPLMPCILLEDGASAVWE